MIGPRAERALIVVGVTAVYSLYWPVNRWTSELPAHDLTTALDRATPLVPGWLYVYALLFVSSYLPILVIRDRHLFRRVAIAALGLEVCALSTFVLYPVRMTLRPELPAADSLTSWGMQLAYYLDEPVNCFPSLHVAAAALAAASVWKVDRVLSVAATVLMVLISASTMLVKQHYVADVVAAVLVVAFWYRVVIHPLDVSDRTTAELRMSRGWLAVVPALYAALIVAVWVLYSAGWVPWEG